MPTSVRDLLSSAGATWHSSGQWGSRPALEGPGLYMVTSSPDPGAITGPDLCHLSPQRIDQLLAMRPEMTVAGQPADSSLLTEALRAMLPAGETVLYVGLAGTSVSQRVDQYFRTGIGARAPHAGGWPIKMLADLDALHVHAASAESPAEAEETALRAFMAGVAPEVRLALCDPALPLPFANLELTKGLRKRHGITGAKESRAPSDLRTPPTARPSVQTHSQPKNVSGVAYSLNVTAADIDSGQIRVTREPKHALGFPRVRSTVSLTLRGESMTAMWDPRLGPDKERSGLLRIGKEAALRLLGGPATVSVDRDDSGLLILR